MSHLDAAILGGAALSVVVTLLALVVISVAIMRATR